MKPLLARLSLPLLVKELTERAARPRTYVLRVIYALLTYGVFAILTNALYQVAWRGGYLQLLGSGGEMLRALLLLQFFGIYLFLPAMMCGLITQEKERDSLVLLFLTDLTPTQIVLQKYLSGLVPMLSSLLVAMPLGAVAYCFGGVSAAELWAGAYVLLLACLQVGAFALLCSAYFRTTVAAFLATYVIGAALVAAPFVVVTLLPLFENSQRRAVSEAMLRLVPFADFRDLSSPSFPKLVWRSFPAILSTLLFLTLARVFLVRRAFVSGSNPLLRAFRGLDALMHRGNRLVGGYMIIKERRSLPDDEPIAWREATQKALGKPHYLFRIFVTIEVPVVLYSLVVLLGSNYSGGEVKALSLVAAIVGGLAVLAICVHGANAFVGERVQQTLEVLLTTPLRAADMLRQKARVMRRFQVILAVPLLTIFAVEGWMEWRVTHSVFQGSMTSLGVVFKEPADRVVYLICSLLTVVVYFPLFSWLSIWIGLKLRTRFKATIAAIAAVVVWCAAPLFVIRMFSGMVSDSEAVEGWRMMAFVLSPIFVPLANESSALPDLFPNPLTAVLLNFGVYSLIAIAIRERCLSGAEHYLRT